MNNVKHLESNNCGGSWGRLGRRPPFGVCVSRERDKLLIQYYAVQITLLSVWERIFLLWRKDKNYKCLRKWISDIAHRRPSFFLFMTAKYIEIYLGWWDKESYRILRGKSIMKSNWRTEKEMGGNIKWTFELGWENGRCIEKSQSRNEISSCIVMLCCIIQKIG